MFPANQGRLKVGSIVGSVGGLDLEVRFPVGIDRLAVLIEGSFSATPRDNQAEPAGSIWTHHSGQTGSETTQHRGDRWGRELQRPSVGVLLRRATDPGTLQAGDFCDEGVQGRAKGRWRASADGDVRDVHGRAMSRTQLPAFTLPTRPDLQRSGKSCAVSVNTEPIGLAPRTRPFPVWRIV